MPRLHVPQPPTRPGDKPDFSGWTFPEPGATPKPDIDEAAVEMRDYAYGLIRVLDMAGKNIAAGHFSVEQVMTSWLQSAGHCANSARDCTDADRLMCRRARGSRAQGAHEDP